MDARRPAEGAPGTSAPLGTEASWQPGTLGALSAAGAPGRDLGAVPPPPAPPHGAAALLKDLSIPQEFQLGEESLPVRGAEVLWALPVA
jgi:hypothetical protein